MVLVKAFCTLLDGVVICGTLGYEGMSGNICGVGIGSGFGTVGDVCSFLSSVVCLKISDCSVGGVVWEVDACLLIRVLAAVASRSRSLNRRV